MPTAGTSGTGSASGYLLSGGQADTLKGLQNQRVEIRGTFQDSARRARANGPRRDGAAMRTAADHLDPAGAWRLRREAVTDCRGPGPGFATAGRPFSLRRASPSTTTQGHGIDAGP